jgi:hypothetical protein
MFRTLIYPSSGAYDCTVELPHWSYVLGSMCVGVSVWLGWSGIRVAGFSHSNPTTAKHQHTLNQEHTTNVVIQQNSRNLLMMDILMSETCWAHKKWNTNSKWYQVGDVQFLAPTIWWWSRSNSSGAIADNTGHRNLSTGIKKNPSHGKMNASVLAATVRDSGGTAGQWRNGGTVAERWDSGGMAGEWRNKSINRSEPFLLELKIKN